MNTTDQPIPDPALTSSPDGSLLPDLIEAALRTVFDPEIPVNIFDLGLVYDTQINDGGNVKITMTLTAPACPVAGDIVRDVQEKVEAIEGVSDCHVNLTFDPPWTKDMMSEEAKLELGFL
jgi:FeS assembly SUF system protein